MLKLPSLGKLLHRHIFSDGVQPTREDMAALWAKGVQYKERLDIHLSGGALIWIPVLVRV